MAEANGGPLLYGAAVGYRYSKLKISTPRMGKDLRETVRVAQTQTTRAVATRKNVHTHGNEKPLPVILFSFGNDDASLREHLSGELFQQHDVVPPAFQPC